MGKGKGKLNKYIMKFSYEEKRKGRLDIFNQDLKRLKSMNEDELNFEYIELKTEIDHKKSILSLYVISIALAVLMDVWNKFFSFMQMVLQYVVTTGDYSEEIMKISLVISTLIALIITVAIILFLLDMSKDIKMMQKRLMLIESVKNKNG